jgi:hypothetical protein
MVEIWRIQCFFSPRNIVTLCQFPPQNTFEGFTAPFLCHWSAEISSPKNKSLRIRVCQKMNEIISYDSSYAQRERNPVLDIFGMHSENIQFICKGIVYALCFHYLIWQPKASKIHTTPPPTLIPGNFTNGDPTSSWNFLKKKSESVTTLLSPYKNTCVKQPSECLKVQELIEKLHWVLVQFHVVVEISHSITHPTTLLKRRRMYGIEVYTVHSSLLWITRAAPTRGWIWKGLSSSSCPA